MAPTGISAAAPARADLDLPWLLAQLGAVLARIKRHLLEAGQHPLVLRGTAGTALIGVGSLTPAFLPANNPLIGVPVIGFLQTGPGALMGMTLLAIGVVVWVSAWLSLRPRLGAPSAPVGAVWWWCAPWLICPPLLSRDAYSYAAQGHLVNLKLNPYIFGPGVVPGALADQVDPIWRYTPAPYGPLALEVQSWFSAIFADQPFAAALAMRVPCLASMALIVWLLPKIVRHTGANLQTVQWLTVLNPLVLIHLVGGAHNDAPMVALLVLAAWLALESRWILASIAVGAAAGFKQPAALAVMMIALIAVGPTFQWSKASLRRLGMHALKSTVVAGSAFAVMTQMTGLGWGWVKVMSIPGTVRPVLSPQTALGVIAEVVLKGMGYRTAASFAVDGFRVVGLLVALGLIAWVTVRMGVRHPVQAMGLVLLLIAVAMPALHAWYLLWGGVLLALARVSVRTLHAMAWGTVLLLSYSVCDTMFRNGFVAMCLTLGAALTWLIARRGRPEFGMTFSPWHTMSLPVTPQDRGSSSLGLATAGAPMRATNAPENAAKQVVRQR